MGLLQSLLGNENNNGTTEDITTTTTRKKTLAMVIDDRNKTTREGIRSLGDAELRRDLLTHGLLAGPITATTRAVFERRLLNKLGVANRDDHYEDLPRTPVKQCQLSLVSGGLATSTPIAGGGGQQVAGTTTPCDSRPILYYAVHIGTTDHTYHDYNTDSLIFTDKKEAFDLFKQDKEARFKMFTDRAEAEIFSRTGIDSTHPVSPLSRNTQSPKTVPSPKNAPIAPPSDRANNYPRPKPQEITDLRLAISNGHLEMVRNIVWSNPRLLISSGDTPVVLQEGCRYNALHIAAMKDKGEICTELLNILTDVKFMSLMYPDDSVVTRQKRIGYLTDLYLNMPDKGACETPLHFACKFGCVNAIKVLLKHCKTDTNRPNRFSETPLDIVCSRYSGKNKVTTAESIKQFFTEQYYVPVLRSDEDTTPRLGDPWSPRVTATEQTSHHTPSSPLAQLSSPMTPDFIVLGEPMSPQSPWRQTKRLTGLVGPMSEKQAKEFKQKFVRKPRNLFDDDSSFSEGQESVRRSDPERGLERITRDLAHRQGLGWSEFWDFLGTYEDLTTVAGLNALETYLSERCHVTCENDDNRVCSVCRDNLGHTKQSNVPIFPGDNAGDTKDTKNSITGNDLGDTKRSNDAILREDFGNTKDSNDSIVGGDLGTTENSLDRCDMGDTKHRQANVWSYRDSAHNHSNDSDEDTPHRDITVDDDDSFLDDGDSVKSTVSNLPAQQRVNHQVPLFIQGNHITKTDHDVLLALDTPVDQHRYPHIDSWRQNIESTIQTNAIISGIQSL